MREKHTAGLIVAVIVDGVREIHATHPSGNYATLCGLDGDDATTGQQKDTANRNEGISCIDCYAIWLQCRNYPPSAFIPRT